MSGIPNPVPGGTFTDTFGAPRSGGRTHAGVDIFAKRGSPILAPVAGTITVAGNDGGAGGNRVWVKGDDGRYYYFAHLDSIIAKVGDRLGFGQQLGTVGNTGNATSSSPHLHFSINGTQGRENPIVNPFLVIDRTIRFPNGAVSLDGAQPISASRDDPAVGEVVTNECLVEFPGIAGVGKVCILRESHARAIVGALCLVAGGLVFAGGVAIIAAYGLQSSKAQSMLRLAGPPGRAAAGRELAEVRAQELAARQRSAEARTRSADARIVDLETRRGQRTVDRDDAGTPHTFADGSTF